MQNVIKIYGAVQEVRAFSLKDFDRPKEMLGKASSPYCIRLENVEINKYAKFDPNIPRGSRVMSRLN